MKAREKAYNCLCDIVLGKSYSNLYLRKEINDFSSADKGLITNIVYGTMQNYLYLRYQWEAYVQSDIAADMALLMDMSIYQFLFMDKVPEYAVVNEAVEIAAKKHKGKYKAMINAMLRRFLREGKRPILGDALFQLSIKTSHPLWVVKMWEKQYGYEIAERICLDDQGAPALAARVNTCVTSRDEIIAANPDFEKGCLSEDALLYHGGNIADTKEYLTGRVSIQDEASQCVALLVDPQPDESILDMCAAPGTKTCHMAQLMKNEGEIIALDIHEHRVELISNAAARLGLSIIQPWCFDACEINHEYDEESFDRVLVDAPCSGYGVMKRKNDIKVHMQPEDMDSLLPLQAKLLDTAFKMVKPGGVLVYSTCTLNKKENEKQIEKFLGLHDNAQLISQRTIFPYEYNTDGFYMAKLVKAEKA